MTTTRKLQVEGHYGPATSTLTYIVADGSTQQTAIVISGRDHGPKSGRTSTRRAGALVGRVPFEGLSVQRQVESHAHQEP
jgi:hypothetical protein|tara:strand:+ start:2685 stop:2924 length:240 start_codon:yes stop_codon:yes gene_type:complete